MYERLWSHLETLSFIVYITFYSIKCVIFSKKSLLSWFCKCLCLDELRICFCLNKHKPWLELFFKFNEYSMKPFQRALVGFNNLWIHWSSTECNWVSMSKIPSPHLQLETWAIDFSISSLINFGIVYIWPICQCWDKRIWFKFFFSPQIELHSVRNIEHLYMSLFLYICPFVCRFCTISQEHHLIIIFGTHL